MAKTASLLQKARTDAAPDAVASARAEWRAKGLKQAEPMLETELAYERSVDTGDKTGFLAALACASAARRSFRVRVSAMEPGDVLRPRH